MTEFDNHIAEISSAVWHFVDEITGGRVANLNYFYNKIEYQYVRTFF